LPPDPLAQRLRNPQEMGIRTDRIPSCRRGHELAENRGVDASSGETPGRMLLDKRGPLAIVGGRQGYIR
jgi:hypothetical protein